MDDVKTIQLFRFRQFLAGVEDKELLIEMRKCVDSQLSLLPNDVPYVEKPKAPTVPVTPYTGTKGWVAIADAPIVAPNLENDIAKKLPKMAKIKYTTYGTEYEAVVKLRGKVRATILKKNADGSYNEAFPTHIYYHKITHVWVS